MNLDKIKKLQDENKNTKQMNLLKNEEIQMKEKNFDNY